MAYVPSLTLPLTLITYIPITLSQNCPDLAPLTRNSLRTHIQARDIEDWEDADVMWQRYDFYYLYCCSPHVLSWILGFLMWLVGIALQDGMGCSLYVLLLYV